MNILKEPISQYVWDIKYRYKRNGIIIDQSISETWDRVAKAVARSEKLKQRREWQRKFYGILEDFRFLPGGRILAGAGTRLKVTLFNCFVMTIEEDSLKGIFKGLLEGALTLQQGGGVGYDFSVLRPYGDLIKKTGLTTSGPVSFMRIWDTTCNTLLSTGARRGAMMAVLRCDHPDIEQFITAKENPHELRHFNVSVMVSDEFMHAVKKDGDWPLVFPTEHQDCSAKEIVYRHWGNSLDPVPCRIYRIIKARDLWQKIIRAAHAYAEPGVLFFDTINRMNNLWYRERINATNPCGEIPLPAYGACNLGAVNLTKFIRDPFTSRAQMAWADLEEAVKTATRFQDNIIDVSHYPLKPQRAQAQGTRRIGLGITGLADALVMLGIPYSSQEAIKLAGSIMKKVAEVTWVTSIELAQEKGKFPFFTPAYLEGEFVQTLDQKIRRELKAHGVRNSHHNTIAPTGTISLLANNVSNGIEPIFKGEYDRHVRTIDRTMTFRVKDYALRMWQETGNDGLPSAWVDAHSLSPEAHLNIQGAMQPFVDNAISKTINIPVNFPFEKLADIYTQAYALGLKGCTIFRPNPITGSVLESLEETPVDHCCQYE